MTTYCLNRIGYYLFKKFLKLLTTFNESIIYYLIPLLYTTFILNRYYLKSILYTTLFHFKNYYLLPYLEVIYYRFMLLITTQLIEFQLQQFAFI